MAITIPFKPVGMMGVLREVVQEVSPPVETAQQIYGALWGRIDCKILVNRDFLTLQDTFLFMYRDDPMFKSNSKHEFIQMLLAFIILEGL